MLETSFRISGADVRPCTPLTETRGDALASKERPPVEWLRTNLDYDKTTGLLTWRNTVNSRAVKGSRAGNLDPAGWRRIRIRGRLLPEHHVIWALVTGAWPAEEVDHRNYVRDDNRWDNLRSVTVVFNRQNYDARGDTGKNRLGLRGIWYEPKKRPSWRGELTLQGKRTHAAFDTLLDAACWSLKHQQARSALQPH